MPDRPGAAGLLIARLRAFLVSGIALGCLLLAGRMLAVGLRSGALVDGLFWTAAAVFAGIRAWLLWRVVGTLRTAPGRYAFVLEQARISATSGRWWVPTLMWTPRWAGQWLHLADAETEESLGWVEVSRSAAQRIAPELVVAVWGWEPRGRHVALSGRFPCAEVIGAVRTVRPEPVFSR